MMRYVDTYEGAGFGREFAWLDLANTLEWDGYGRVTDHLNDPAWLARILTHWNLSTQVPRPVQIAKLIALRGLLRRMAAKLIDGKSLHARDLSALNSYLNVPVRVQVFQRQNGVRSELVPLHAGWPWILSRIAASFAEMLALQRPDRLKYCLNEGCKWIFYDKTKGNTRRWCNDKTCGNRDRVRRARERNRKARRQG
ncbi:MAG: CGNR zinc finger domain-containing protein [Acidobacteriota bacterium]|nr:CGNR zinc finger domain-containing protein [Acidobacteriota bacterium]